MEYIIKCPCGKTILFTAESKVGRKKYCSKKCFYLYRPKTGFQSGHIFYKGGEKGWFKRKEKVKLDNKGYERRWVNGKIRRTHRVILENKLKRKLKLFEVCHHLNGIKTDNRPENLVVMTKKKHDKLHNGKKI